MTLAAMAVIGGCGADGGEAPEAQPAPEVTVFRNGAFDQLPRYPRSDEFAPATETAAVVSQTFSVRNATPQQILDFYRSTLERWTVVEPVQQVGPDALRASWRRDGRQLQVSASRAPSVDVTAPTVEPPMSQYSLQIGPPDAFP